MEREGERMHTNPTSMDPTGVMSRAVLVAVRGVAVHPMRARWRGITQDTYAGNRLTNVWVIFSIHVQYTRYGSRMHITVFSCIFVKLFFCIIPGHMLLYVCVCVCMQ